MFKFVVRTAKLESCVCVCAPQASLQLCFPAGPNHLLRGSQDLSDVPSPLCLFARLLNEGEPEARVGANRSA